MKTNTIVARLLLTGMYYATAEYTYLPPEDPPTRGCKWATSADYPGVRLRLSLPKVPGGGIPDFLVSSQEVMGAHLSAYWGSEWCDDTRMIASQHRAATLREAYAAARAELSKAMATLAEIVAARQARLDERERTIAMALADGGEIFLSEEATGE